jgi:hypothetical protein
MNVNTYDATPMHEEVIASSGNRVFDDGSDFYPTWFEVKPGRFTGGRDWADAEERAGYTVPIRLASLREVYGDSMAEVTGRYPRN